MAFLHPRQELKDFDARALERIFISTRGPAAPCDSFVRSFVSYGGYEKMKKQWKYNRYTAILSGYVYIYILFPNLEAGFPHKKKKTIVSHCFLVDFLLNPIIEVP